MNRSIQLGLIIGSIVTLSLIIVVYMFKPLPSPPHTAKPQEKSTPAVATPTVEKKVISTTPVQTDTVSVPNQAELLQQRDRLYKNFAAISDALSHGQQPDLRQVSQILEQQEQLVRTGTVAADEAISYCQFLRQILPAMERQIDQNIIELEQLKRSAIQKVQS
jgi:phosphoglycerate-specific signal transduction histidine kinase